MVVMESVFYVMKVLVSMIEKGFRSGVTGLMECQQRRFFGTCKTRRLGVWTQFNDK